MRTFACLIITLACLAAPSSAWAAKTYGNNPPRVTEKVKKDQPQDLKAQADASGAAQQLEYAKSIQATDPDTARIYAQKAADQNFAEAWYWLGQSGLGVSEGVNYYERAASLGHAEAYNHILDEALFNAREKADTARAKRIADMARKNNVVLQNGAAKFRIVDLCYAAGKPKVPDADMPNAERKKQILAGNSECLQLKREAENNGEGWEDYRDCILSQSQLNGNDLAELYANGWGVKRDPKRAIAMLCYSSSAEAELEGAVNAVYSTRNQSVLTQPFKFCDHATSGINTGICASQAEKFAEEKRQSNFSSMITQFTSAQEDAFKVLQTAANDYFAAHSKWEQDMSGTAHTAIAVDAESSLRNNFSNSIQNFENSNLPTDMHAKQVDQQLNQIYQRLMVQYRSPDSGTVTVKGIQDTQRKFLAYRDAMIKFGTVRYAGTRAELWHTWATQQRIATLERLLKHQ